MKIIHTKDILSVQQKLHSAVCSDTIRVEQVPGHGKYELQESKWLWTWKTIASVDTYEKKIIVYDKNWRKHSRLIRQLASKVEELYSRINDITIEVHP
jgi:hypothetical protein